MIGVLRRRFKRRNDEIAPKTVLAMRRRQRQRRTAVANQANQGPARVVVASVADVGSLDHKNSIDGVFFLSAFGKDLRIVGGVGTDAREFPYMASLRYIGQNKHICAGTIITDKHILSVAHCIYEMEIYYGFLLVYLGISNMLDESGSIFHVTKLHIHPNYIGEKTGKNGFHNDIAIYTLHKSIEFNAVQNKIELPTTDISSGSSVTISGWGLTSFPSDQPPNQIQKATVKVLEYSKCAEIFDFRILNDQICTYEEGMGICTGDSGGPVTKNGKLVGIISFALPCAKGIPDIHTNVYTHLDFIHSIIDN